MSFDAPASKRTRSRIVSGFIALIHRPITLLRCDVFAFVINFYLAPRCTLSIILTNRSNYFRCIDSAKHGACPIRQTLSHNARLVLKRTINAATKLRRRLRRKAGRNFANVRAHYTDAT